MAKFKSIPLAIADCTTINVFNITAYTNETLFLDQRKGFIAHLRHQEAISDGLDMNNQDKYTHKALPILSSGEISACETVIVRHTSTGRFWLMHIRPSELDDRCLRGKQKNGKPYADLIQHYVQSSKYDVISDFNANISPEDEVDILVISQNGNCFSEKLLRDQIGCQINQMQFVEIPNEIVTHDPVFRQTKIVINSDGRWESVSEEELIFFSIHYVPYSDSLIVRGHIEIPKGNLSPREYFCEQAFKKLAVGKNLSLKQLRSRPPTITRGSDLVEVATYLTGLMIPLSQASNNNEIRSLFFDGYQSDKSKDELRDEFISLYHETSSSLVSKLEAYEKRLQHDNKLTDALGLSSQAMYSDPRYAEGRENAHCLAPCEKFPAKLSFFGVRRNNTTGPKALQALQNMSKMNDKKETAAVANQFLLWAKNHNRSFDSNAIREIKAIGNMKV